MREEITPLKDQVNYLKQQVDQNHREMLKAKFDQFKQMESEDVTAVQEDVEGLKIRVTKLEESKV